MERVIVGYDDSPAARGALAWAIHHAQRSGSELVIVFVVSSSSEWELNAVQINTDPIRTEFQRRLRGEWTELVRAAGVRYETHLEVGRPAEVLLSAARRNEAALIVIGMTARGTLGELVLSSVGHRVSHRAVRPVVTVPTGWTPDASNDCDPAAELRGRRVQTAVIEGRCVGTLELRRRSHENVPRAAPCARPERRDPCAWSWLATTARGRLLTRSRGRRGSRASATHK